MCEAEQVSILYLYCTTLLQGIKHWKGQFCDHLSLLREHFPYQCLVLHLFPHQFRYILLVQCACLQHGKVFCKNIVWLMAASSSHFTFARTAACFTPDFIKSCLQSHHSYCRCCSAARHTLSPQNASWIFFLNHMLLTKVHEIPRVLLDIKVKIEILACQRNDCVLEDTESICKGCYFLGRLLSYMKKCHSATMWYNKWEINGREEMVIWQCDSFCSRLLLSWIYVAPLQSAVCTLQVSKASLLWLYWVWWEWSLHSS